MTRLWILSDLHLETFPYPEAFAPKRPDFDVLVSAGDIWQGDPLRGLRFLAELAQGKPVITVLGNHEHWNGVFGETIAQARRDAIEAGVTLLEGNSATIEGCKFVGATLWTDYALAGDAVDMDARSGEAISVRWDNRIIPLTPSFSAAVNVLSRFALMREMARDNHHPLVVITHHAPHKASLPRGVTGWVAGNCASDLSSLTDTGRVDLWVHGHIHHSADYTRPNGTRIVCNPAGNLFSNPGFDEHLVIDV